MKIIKKKISELKSPEYNPRISVKDDKTFYNSLKKSMKRFGYIDPIIWNERTGNVVGGNQRLEILREAGKKEVEVVVVDFTLEEEKAANIALNKISGNWFEKKLSELLVEINEKTPDLMEFVGFSKKELKTLLEGKESLKLQPIYQIIIECENEFEQERIFNELEKSGYRCRPLIL